MEVKPTYLTKTSPNLFVKCVGLTPDGSRLRKPDIKDLCDLLLLTQVIQVSFNENPVIALKKNELLVSEEVKKGRQDSSFHR
jgi:hypothetical protein